MISIILLLQFCQKCSILSFSERPVYFFHFFNLSKMAHFVILEKRSSNYEISMISLHHMLWAIRLFCQKCSILSFSDRPVYFFTFQYCHQRPILSFWKSGIQIMRYSISTTCDFNYFASSIFFRNVQFCQVLEAFFSTVDFCEQDPFYFIFEMNFCDDVKNLWKTSSAIVFKVAHYSIRSWNNILLHE